MSLDSYSQHKVAPYSTLSSTFPWWNHLQQLGFLPVMALIGMDSVVVLKETLYFRQLQHQRTISQQNAILIIRKFFKVEVIWKLKVSCPHSGPWAHLLFGHEANILFRHA